MAKYICRRFKTVTGKKGRYKGRKIKRCVNFETKGRVRKGFTVREQKRRRRTIPVQRRRGR